MQDTSMITTRQSLFKMNCEYIMTKVILPYINSMIFVSRKSRIIMSDNFNL